MHVILAWREDGVGANFAGEVDAVLANLCRDDLGGTGCLRDGGRHQSDRAHAGDEDGLAIERTSVSRVNGIPEGIFEGSEFRKDATVGRPRVGDRNDRIRGEAAVDVYAKNSGVHADVRLTGPALAAYSADDVRFACDKVADRAIGDPFAEFDDGAAEFVADDTRWLDARRRPGVPSVDMEVSTANRGGFQTELYLAGANSRFVNVDDLYARSRADFCDGFHCGRVY